MDPLAVLVRRYPTIQGWTPVRTTGRNFFRGRQPAAAGEPAEVVWAVVDPDHSLIALKRHKHEGDTPPQSLFLEPLEPYIYHQLRRQVDHAAAQAAQVPR